MVERVDSKHLFHYPLRGVVDEDVAAFESSLEEEMVTGVAKLMLHKMQELSEAESEASDREFTHMIRCMIDPFIQKIGSHPVLRACADHVTETHLTVPTSHCGEHDVHVYVYTPRTRANCAQSAAYIHAHGGGGVASSARDAKPWLDYLAVHCDVVVFNVDYRLAPETKSPNNVLDFYESVKYIHNNAEKLAIDPGKFLHLFLSMIINV